MSENSTRTPPVDRRVTASKNAPASGVVTAVLAAAGTANDYFVGGLSIGSGAPGDTRCCVRSSCQKSSGMAVVSAT
jgi:hypothetical protein